MLISTHQITSRPPLPPGWTEHKAPTGHLYYYHSTTGQSTYSRPIPDPVQASAVPVGVSESFLQYQNAENSSKNDKFYKNNQGYEASAPYRGNTSRGDRGWSRGTRAQPKDKPKSRQKIPGHENWMLVHTKFDRRFVYNTEKDESFWRIPDKLKNGILEIDQLRILQKAGILKNAIQASDTERPPCVNNNPIDGSPKQPELDQNLDENSEYEEVEVTDEEDERETATLKQPNGDASKSEAPVEFNEDDIAYQLAAMGEEYGLEPDEYGDHTDWDDGRETTREDSAALFKDLLNDAGINPYSSWEKIVEEGKLINDIRYTSLPSMKLRKEIWEDWAKDKIKKLQASRAKEEKDDPRISYTAFLEKHATPKLYWLEFKRKFKKEPEMRTTAMSDKDREKLYREHINRLKQLK
ncbi:hypothetical protein K3495_g8735 [Podosphaera aphanis]|nr:hypothetical protein K3495_g8735 [Podosphaera aphanis]